MKGEEETSKNLSSGTIPGWGSLGYQQSQDTLRRNALFTQSLQTLVYNVLKLA